MQRMAALSSTACALLLLPLLFCAAAPPRFSGKAADVALADRVLVIAHRGDSIACPENTLPAFTSAVALGSDLVELDYHHSADGIPIVIHDGTLDRTTDARDVFGGENIPVSSKTYSDLSKLDAGKWFNPKFTGTKLPTLEQALDAIQPGSVTLIERKSGDAKTLIELLSRKKLLCDVVIHAFDWKFLAECHDLAPEVLIEALGTDRLTDKQLVAVQKTGAIALGWDRLYLHAQSITRIHEAGYRAWVWTVDQPDHASRLIKGQIDALITDCPARMKPLVASEILK